ATTGFQVGSFTAGQVADEDAVIGKSVELAAQAVFANYMQLNGKLGELSSAVPERTIPDALLPKVVKFA
ncbi:MAG: hypothetical protein V4736_07770, partial [Bdellovibrionota bacterium]